MAKFEFVEWLLSWLLEERDYSFEWDSGNKTKSRSKHGIETSEIEEVFKSRPAIPLGVQTLPAVPEERLAVLLSDQLSRVSFSMWFLQLEMGG